MYTDVELVAQPLSDPAWDAPVIVSVEQEADETSQRVMSWLFTVATTWADDYLLYFNINGQVPGVNAIGNAFVLPGPVDISQSTLEGPGVGALSNPTHPPNRIYCEPCSRKWEADALQCSRCTCTA